MMVRPWHARVAALFVSMLVVMRVVTASGASADERLTNLDHLDHLLVDVALTPIEGHATYRLDEDPTVRMPWTYAEPRDDGSYERIGGGSYDPDTDTWGQGAFNADDISRAAVVYLRHWRQFGDDHSLQQARELLRGLTYLQTFNGPNAGNVVLWMQPDGALNPSPEPPDSPDPSDSDASYWLARTLWALGEGYVAFTDAGDDAFAGFLEDRLQLAIAAVNRQVVDPAYGTYQTVDGLQWPAWLIDGGTDASSEAVYGLSAYVEATQDPDAETLLRRLAQGISEMQLGATRGWPFGALMPWAESRSVWHGWGDQMAGALAEASSVLGEPAWLASAIEETAQFTPHLLAQGGPQNGWLPAPIVHAQIAYGADATLQNLLRTGHASRRAGLVELAGFAGAWFFGNNPSGEPTYDPASGRTFDGVEGDGSINRNSGAESTIHGLLSMLQLDQHPEVRADARVAARTAHVTWQMVEAEEGVSSDGAQVVEPESLWTGESQWSGRGYVALEPGQSVAMDVDPVVGWTLLMPVLERQQAAWWRNVLWLSASRMHAGPVSFGGAGEAGITPTEGYLDVATAPWMVKGDGGQVEVLNVDRSRRTAHLDGVIVQPEIERLTLGDDEDGRALLRSFSYWPRTASVELPGDGTARVKVYDTAGRQVHDYEAEGTEVAVRVRPGGFSVVERS